MNAQIDLRTDFGTAAAISKGMKLLAEFGYERAHTYFEEVGIAPELAGHMLSIRFDRRTSLGVPAQQGFGVFRCADTDA